MNKVILMGRLTADPELRQTQTGMSSCRFTIAIDRPTVDKTTGQRQADFIRCTAWDKSAENINRFFRKGSMIMIEGALRTGSYQDRNHPDVTHYTTDIFVERWEFTGSKTEGGNGGNGNYGAPQNNYNNNYNNGYNNGGYGNQGYNQAPPPPAPVMQNNESMSYGNDSEFEEILSDGDVPF